MLWKNKALNLCNFCPRRVKIHLTRFIKPETAQTNGSTSKVFCNFLIWFDRVLLKLISFLLQSFACKPHPEIVPAWKERLGPFQESESQCSFFLQWPMRFDAVLHCVERSWHTIFCSWKGIFHCQLFTALSGNWRGENSYCLSALFSQRLSASVKVCHVCMDQENLVYLLPPLPVIMTQHFLWQERN